MRGPYPSGPAFQWQWPRALRNPPSAGSLSCTGTMDCSTFSPRNQSRNRHCRKQELRFLTKAPPLSNASCCSRFHYPALPVGRVAWLPPPPYSRVRSALLGRSAAVGIAFDWLEWERRPHHADSLDCFNLPIDLAQRRRNQTLANLVHRDGTLHLHVI